MHFPKLTSSYNWHTSRYHEKSSYTIKLSVSSGTKVFIFIPYHTAGLIQCSQLGPLTYLYNIQLGECGGHIILKTASPKEERVVGATL